MTEDTVIKVSSSEESTGVTMGRKTIARFLLTLACVGLPLTVQAQQQTGGSTGGNGGGGSDMDFSTPEPQTGGGDAQGTGGTAGAAEPGTGTGAGLQLDVPGGEVQPQRHPFNEEIYAVQRIFALRYHRVELTPTANFALNDPFVSHTGFGLTANYWISNVLAVGLTGVFFQGLNVPSNVNLQVGRSTGLVSPINEYQMAAALNFSYVPLYGKFSMFSRYIFHWDLYLTAGVGVMRSRPIPAIDPEIRTFDWNTAILFDAGLGVRIFFSRAVGLTLELRNFVYPELLENTTVPPEGPSTCAACRRNRTTWTNESALTDNVMVSIGLTVFLPFSVNYRLPK
jgi:outer membrane beta-barrel protein